VCDANPSLQPQTTEVCARVSRGALLDRAIAAGRRGRDTPRFEAVALGVVGDLERNPAGLSGARPEARESGPMWMA
jgi:hypothetical protein